MNKPTNAYKKGSTIWKVMEGDWEDLTVRQIAEVLDVKYRTVRQCITRIKRQTGYEVPHISEKERRDGDGEDTFEPEKAASTLGHKRGEGTRSFCVYTVYNNKTDFPVIVDGEARDCAKAMGIKVDSFYSYVERR